MDSAAVTVRVDMPDLATREPLDEPISDEWKQVAQKLPRSSLIDEVLALAKIGPDPMSSRPREVDLKAMAKRAKVKIEYAPPFASSEKRVKGPTILVPTTYAKWDERFTIARGLAERAMAAVRASRLNGGSKVGYSQDLTRLVEDPLPIQIDAVASAILMPTDSLHEQVSQDGRFSARTANAFAVPVAAARLRLLTPGVLD